MGVNGGAKAAYSANEGDGAADGVGGKVGVGVEVAVGATLAVGDALATLAGGWLTDSVAEGAGVDGPEPAHPQSATDTRRTAAGLPKSLTRTPFRCS